jgi:uncharacterized protein YkwD
MRGRVLVLAACAFFTACSAAQAADDPYAALLAPSGTCGAADDQLGLDRATAQLTMQCLTNYARAHSGLAPVRLNTQLNDAGDAKLRANVSCNEFSHTPCGEPFTNVFADYLRGIRSYEVGENIEWGTGKYGTPREAMNGWLHSTGHRENILRASYKELGIGYLTGQAFQGHGGATLWSQEFGATNRAAAEPISATKKPFRRHRRLRARLR